MITGIHAETFSNLQLNAGVFLKGFDYSAATSAATLRSAIAAFIAAGKGVMGATRGGGTFQCTPTLRNIEADGLRAAFKGGTVNDGWTVKMTGTLLEITPDNFKDVLMSADTAEDKANGVTTVTVRTSIKDEDYIPKLCWVGDTSKGFVLIELRNALNTTGANFTFTDKGEGTLPFEFLAHQNDPLEQEEAPCTVLFFN